MSFLNMLQSRFKLLNCLLKKNSFSRKVQKFHCFILQDLRLVRDKFTHVSRGFAFVHFHSVSPLIIGEFFH